MRGGLEAGRLVQPDREDRAGGVAWLPPAGVRGAVEQVGRDEGDRGAVEVDTGRRLGGR